MSIRRHSTVAVAATFLMIGATASGLAQNPPPPAKVPPHQEGMKGMHAMPTMGDMMGGPHHVLAMAYRDNLATFAGALGGQVPQAKTVNLDLAGPAVAEMRRSFEQMRQHHQAQMTMMGGRMDSTMSGMMQHMETHVSALREHLTALESEVNAGTPDPKKVLEHTTEILKHCSAMSAMPAKAKPH
ncbi:MAG: hypothetical protein HOP28_13280 [Gemmatimonadales bacterium]|nr:hypothetical protein [Gemmatimonadales bacterium]